MTLNDLLPVTARAAERHGLPVELVRAIVVVESGGDPWAVRYEPAFFERYVQGRGHRVFAGCSRDTEERLRATSFGLMQIMGQVAREDGFDEPFLTALCDADIGLEYGCRRLAYLRQRHLREHGWAGVVAAYNAGSPRKNGNGLWANQAYVDKVKKAGAAPQGALFEVA